VDHWGAPLEGESVTNPLSFILSASWAHEVSNFALPGPSAMTLCLTTAQQQQSQLTTTETSETVSQNESFLSNYFCKVFCHGNEIN
jgi:hypothetical protein